MYVLLCRDGRRRGWEDDAWARGGVLLLPTLAGHGWPISETVSIVAFFPFENQWRSLAGCWNGEKFLAQLLLGWNYRAWGHICSDPPMRISQDAIHKQLLRLMMLTIAGSPLGMKYWWGWYEKWRCLESPPRFLDMEYWWGWYEMEVIWKSSKVSGYGVLLG